MNVSVVVVTYRRLEHLDLVLKAWLAETPDVWLCDCSKDGYMTDLPVNIVRCSPDPGNKVRHAVATMTQGDLVIKADDDLYPLPGLVADFVSNYQTYGDAIYGIHGRVFLGPRYYVQTRMWGPGNCRKTTPVDFVGVITCSPRKYLAMDLKNCATEVEDLYWQMVCYRDAKKYVIATRNVHHMPESRDAGRLCHDPISKRVRSTFYQTWYLKNYRLASRIPLTTRDIRPVHA